MQLSMILASLCGMALAVPAAMIRSPAQVDELGRPVLQEGEFLHGQNPFFQEGDLPHGNPALPEGAGGNHEQNAGDNNELGDGLQVPDNIDELAQGAAQEWNGQDLGADVLGDLGAVIPL